MAIIVILITISLSIAIMFLLFFYWNMRSGQYDDTYTPSVRMLFDSKPGKEHATTTEGGEKVDTSPDGNAPDAKL